MSQYMPDMCEASLHASSFECISKDQSLNTTSDKDYSYNDSSIYHDDILSASSSDNS